MLLQELLGNDFIVKALLFNSENLSGKTIPPDFDRTSLLYSRIWPFQFVPEISDEPKTMITMSFIFKPYGSGKNLKVSNIKFFVIIHKSLMSVNTGLRTDYLLHHIDSTFNQTDIFGATKWLFDGAGDFIVDTARNWVGASIAYRNVEFT